MVGDRRTTALSSIAWASVALVVGSMLLGACADGRLTFPGNDKPAAKAPPVVEEFTADVHGNLASFDVVEVAIQRPGGDAALSVRTAFREEIYAQILSRGFSPLALDYVDAAGKDVAQPGRTFPVRCSISDVRRSSDGGVLVSGWLGMVAAQEDGTETTLYLAEVRDLAVPPIKGRSRADGGPETGRHLAQFLLRKLPAR